MSFYRIRGSVIFAKIVWYKQLKVAISTQAGSPYARKSTKLVKQILSADTLEIHEILHENSKVGRVTFFLKK
jgi:siroheme synthase (precorrin-2 oxidase/ferrochelatase)